MKDRTKFMIQEIDIAHDWTKGQTYGGNGTRLSSTDICRVCLLRRHWFSDPQNGIKDDYRFSDGETNQDLSLRQVFARACA